MATVQEKKNLTLGRLRKLRRIFEAQGWTEESRTGKSTDTLRDGTKLRTYSERQLEIAGVSHALNRNSAQSTSPKKLTPEGRTFYPERFQMPFLYHRSDLGNNTIGSNAKKKKKKGTSPASDLPASPRASISIPTRRSLFRIPVVLSDESLKRWGVRPAAYKMER